MAGRDRRSFIDVITSIFNRPSSTQQANQTSPFVPKRRFDNERPLPPVVRVGEAVPGNLSQTSALIEAIQPKEKSISDYLNMVNSKPTGEYTSPVAVSLDENYNVVKPRDISASEAYNPGRMDPTGMLGESRIPQSIIEGGLDKEVEIKEKEIQSDDPASRSYSTAEVKLDMKKMETEALARETAVDKAANAAKKDASGDASILSAGETKNLQDGDKEFSSAYDTLDKAFDDYLSFLEKKKGEGAEKLSEAEEAREARLFAELAATSARFAGQAGPGGFLAKLNQAALPSIAELKNIQKDFRKERQSAKDIEQEVLKEGLNINLARAKLNMQRSELESQNALRAAKSLAEGVVGGLDANEGANFVAKISEGMVKLDPRGRSMIASRYLSNLGRGMTPRAAANNALDYAITINRNPSLTSGAEGGSRKTASDTVEERARENIQKVRGTGRTPVNNKGA